MKFERVVFMSILALAGTTMGSAKAEIGQSCQSICVLSEFNGGIAKIYTAEPISATAASADRALPILQSDCLKRARRIGSGMIGSLYFGVFVTHTESETEKRSNSSSYSNDVSSYYRSPYCYYRRSRDRNSGWSSSSSSFEKVKSNVDWVPVRSSLDIFCNEVTYNPDRPVEYDGDQKHY